MWIMTLYSAVIDVENLLLNEFTVCFVIFVVLNFHFRGGRNPGASSCNIDDVLTGRGTIN